MQADNPNIGFFAAQGGLHVFTDNMQIPVGAPHAYTAEKFMDFVYDPEMQAQIAEYDELRAAGEGRQGGLREGATRSWRRTS